MKRRSENNDENTTFVEVKALAEVYACENDKEQEFLRASRRKKMDIEAAFANRKYECWIVDIDGDVYMRLYNTEVQALEVQRVLVQNGFKPREIHVRKYCPDIYEIRSIKDKPSASAIVNYFKELNKNH